MARSRPRRADARPKRRRVPPTLARPRPKRPTAETLLLDLARDISVRGVPAGPAAGVEAIVAMLAAAYAPDTPLAKTLHEDWLRRRGDKTAQLALAWAREQVRLAVAEEFQRARAKRVMRTDGDVDTLAWLVLAACEALAHEPPSAVSDRAHALLAFLRGR